MDLGTLLTFFSASFAFTVLPGPDLLYVITLSLSKSRRAAIQLSWGLTTGLLFHTTFVALGWSQVLINFPQFIWGIKLVGSLYLLFIAFKSLRLVPKVDSQKGPPIKDKNYFWRGLIMNLANPKVTIFFMIFFPGFIFSQEWTLPLQFALLGIIFWGQSLLVFCGVIFLGDKLKRYVVGDNFYNYQNKVQALVLTVIALLLLYSI
tara:strand:- start:394 stop:1008 length:615 start_codon:yes stop_codon:yes gene_type:complete